MDNLTSRPYRPNPDWCCEACIGWGTQHAEWCERNEDRKQWVERLGATGPQIVIDPGMPKNTILLVSQPRQGESLEEWAKRCGSIAVGEPEPPVCTEVE